jgi:hypothetical protein
MGWAGKEPPCVRFPHGRDSSVELRSSLLLH